MTRAVLNSTAIITEPALFYAVLPLVLIFPRYLISANAVAIL